MYLKKSFFPNDLFIAHLSFFFLFISNMFHQLSQLHERINEIIKFLGAEVAGELRLRFSAIEEGFTKMGIPHIGANVCLKMAEEELNELGEQLRFEMDRECLCHVDPWLYGMCSDCEDHAQDMEEERRMEEEAWLLNSMLGHE